MAAPTLVNTYNSSYTTDTSSSRAVSSVVVQVGDRITVLAGAEIATTAAWGGTGDLSSCTMTGVTFSRAQNVGSGSADAKAVLWTGTATSAGTFTLTVDRNVTQGTYWGVTVWVHRNSDGFGNSAGSVDAGAGAPTGQAITTTQDNSAIMYIAVDWNATDGATRAYRSINGAPTEVVYARDAAKATVYVIRYDDAGAAGSKTAGLSAPSDRHFSQIAVEIKGSAAAGPSQGSADVGLAIDVATTGARASRSTSAPTIAIDVAAAGARASRATSAPTLAIDAAATGRAAMAGSAALGLAIDVAVTGRAPAVGQVNVDLALDLATAGRRDSKGSAAPDIAIDVAATGVAPGEETPSMGSANVDLAIDVAVAGSAASKGSAALALQLDVAAAGRAVKAGTANLELAIDVAVVGRAPARGSVDVGLAIDIAASGLTARRGSANVTLSIDPAAVGRDPSARPPILVRALLMAAEHRVGLSGGYHVGLETEHEVSLLWEQ